MHSEREVSVKLRKRGAIVAQRSWTPLFGQMPKKSNVYIRLVSSYFPEFPPYHLSGTWSPLSAPQEWRRRRATLRLLRPTCMHARFAIKLTLVMRWHCGNNNSEFARSAVQSRSRRRRNTVTDLQADELGKKRRGNLLESRFTKSFSLRSNPDPDRRSPNATLARIGAKIGKTSLLI